MLFLPNIDKNKTLIYSAILIVVLFFGYNQFLKIKGLEAELHDSKEINLLHTKNLSNVYRNKNNQWQTTSTVIGLYDSKSIKNAIDEMGLRELIEASGKSNQNRLLGLQKQIQSLQIQQSMPKPEFIASDTVKKTKTFISKSKTKDFEISQLIRIKDGLVDSSAVDVEVTDTIKSFIYLGKKKDRLKILGLKLWRIGDREIKSELIHSNKQIKTTENSQVIIVK